MSVLTMFSLKSRKWGLSSKCQSIYPPAFAPPIPQFLTDSDIEKKKVGPFSFIFFFSSENSANYIWYWHCTWNVYLLRKGTSRSDRTFLWFWFLEWAAGNHERSAYFRCSFFRPEVNRGKHQPFKTIASVWQVVAGEGGPEAVSPQLASEESPKQWAVAKTFSWFSCESAEKTHTRKDHRIGAGNRFC